jgi:hypothetical protein
LYLLSETVWSMRAHASTHTMVYRPATPFGGVIGVFSAPRRIETARLVEKPGSFAQSIQSAASREKL